MDEVRPANRDVHGMDKAVEDDRDTGLVVISRGGVSLAQKLAVALPGKVTLHIVDRYSELVNGPSSATLETFSLPLRPVINELFPKYHRLALFMPVGAAVRLLAPLLRHKHRDPAVVCVDDAGRFVVSLLSGHVGGADELAEEVAAIVGATAVITSGSYVKNTLAADLLGREFGWQPEADAATITRVSAAVVNGEPVGVFQDAGERGWWPAGIPLPENLRVYPTLSELVSSECNAALVISDRENVLSAIDASNKPSGPPAASAVVYRPRSLVVGLGCRRGVSAEHLEDLLVSTFEQHGLSPKSIKYFATADVKQDEAGIQELAGKYGVPVQFYTAEELNRAFGEVSGGAAASGMTPSEARRLLGVWGVSEPAALLASGAGELLVSREKTDRATIAVARVPFDE